MLWICLTAWAGLFIWYFRMRKKAEDHKLVRRIFCLAATGFIAGTALCLPIGVRKVSGDEKAELQLERGALGSQPTEEKLEVSVGNQKPERITLSVPARAYSAEEIEEAFSTAIEALDEIILGENTHGSGIFVLLCIGDVFIPITAGKEREVGIMKLISEFWKEEDAVGVVEVILILVVLIGLVLIFKKQLVSLVNSLMEKVTNQSNTV